MLRKHVPDLRLITQVIEKSPVHNYQGNCTRTGSLFPHLVLAIMKDHSSGGISKVSPILFGDRLHTVGLKDAESTIRFCSIDMIML